MTCSYQLAGRAEFNREKHLFCSVRKLQTKMLLNKAESLITAIIAKIGKTTKPTQKFIKHILILYMGPAANTTLLTWPDMVCLLSKHTGTR